MRLSSAVHRWPTPVATEATKNPSDSLSRAVSPDLQFSFRSKEEGRTFPTPTASQHKGWSPGHNRAETNDRLDYTIEREAHQQGGGKLNPTWVEWLMGWPLGWTSTEPLPPATWDAWQRAFGIESADSSPSATDRSPTPPALPSSTSSSGS